MNVNARFRFSALAVVLFLLVSACSPEGATPTVISTAAESGPAAVPSSAEVVTQPTETVVPQFKGEIPPELPANYSDHAGDVDSSEFADRKMVKDGDYFIHGLYERPFNANMMDKYFPDLDIVDFYGFRDNTWGYATITLKNTDANGKLPAQYAVELDLNKDGRGDWLMRVSNPSSLEWTTKGVQVWQDANGDVGSESIMSADNPSIAGDGYETLVFDQGQGDLMDGAWARIKSDDPKTVELAFKLSVIGNPSSYAMGAWAGTSLDPAQFDHNDHMTHVQAGSPLPDLTVYPLQAMAEIDNTCRLAIDFKPSVDILGLCESVQKREGECEACGGRGQDQGGN